MRSIYTYQVKSATGSNLCPMGITGCKFKIGDKGYKTDFVVCKNLTRPCILGIDFLRKHNIFAGWTAEGKFKLISQQEFLVESLEVLMDGPMIYNQQGVTVPGRKLAMIKVSVAFLYFPVNIREYSGLSGCSKTGSRSDVDR